MIFIVFFFVFYLYKILKENMRKVVGIMEELDKKGKWKWYLHYRDSRRLRENARWGLRFYSFLPVAFSSTAPKAHN